MLRDPLLSCDWGAKGRTASPYPHRPGVGELHLGLATAPPPLEAAAPDCRGEAICTTPCLARKAESRVPVTVIPRNRASVSHAFNGEQE